MVSALLRPLLLLSIAPWQVLAAGPYKWPDPEIDQLENILYVSQFGGVVKTCAFAANLGGSGRTNSAEWVRLAYHDMATADVATGIGGLDASIQFELSRPENVGKAFKDAMIVFQDVLTPYASMADLIAIGLVLAVTSCTVSPDHAPVYIPLRVGRVDAKEAGRAGVPEPHQELDKHEEVFKAAGFNKTEMIALVACGHTLGGVHGADFPEIVPVPKNTTGNTESRQDFDGSVAKFDNSVATEFLQNTTNNPLVSGHNETTRSDHRVFNSDGGETIRKMAASNNFFVDTCGSLFERMINTVPKGVNLTQPLEPIPIKPMGIDIVLDDAGNLTISGEIRVLEDRHGHPGREVRLHLKPRPGTTGPQYPPVKASKVREKGPPYPYSPSFTWWGFNVTVPAIQGVSSFTVEIADMANSTSFDNRGEGFPLVMEVVPQRAKSCIARPDGRNYLLNVTAAVLDDAHLNSVELAFPLPIRQNGSLFPAFDWRKTQMQAVGKVGATGYTIYNASLYIESTAFFGMLLFEVYGHRGEQTFESRANPWAGLASCGYSNT